MQKERYRQMVRRTIFNQLAGRAFRGWRERTEDNMEERHRMRRALKYMRNRVMSKAWNRWEEYWHAMRQLRKALQWFINRRLRLSFTAWTYMVDEKARIKHLMKTYARRIVGRKKRAALLTLYEWAMERIELKRKLRTALARR